VAEGGTGAGEKAEGTGPITQHRNTPHLHIPTYLKLLLSMSMLHDYKPS
jgi:hypothetical protein